MRSPGAPPPERGIEHESGASATGWQRLSVPGLLAVAVFLLAFLSPVEHADSDPGIALLASQSLLDHHTLALDAYRGDPACVYDFERDYRIRERGGSYYYYSLGVPLLSLPAVWLANRAGFHMLDHDDESALQNLLSALCCAFLAVFLYRLCRSWVGEPASLAITTVSLLGSSLTSTLATGLWNANYEILLLALGLLHLVRRETTGAPRPDLAALGLLAALAFLCRPTAAFAVVAGVLALPRVSVFRERRFWVLFVPAAVMLVGILIGLDAAGWIPRYYSPLKLTPATPLATGLYGVLLSPSRGLLVFSPFLVPVAAGAILFLPALAGQRIYRLATLWIGLQVLAVATKDNWWGGHSFGPRLLTEVMLPAVLLSCLVWRRLERRGSRRQRILAAAGYLALGLVAVFIHGYQGLFNHHASRWNHTPDIDRSPRLAFDWRHPQFLASERSLEERVFELQRRRLGSYVLGEEIPYDGDGALFHSWYPPEAGWRWSRGRSPEIILRLDDLSGRDFYLLRLRLGALGRQEVGLEVNGAGVGALELEGHAGRERAYAFPGDLLRPGENRFRFSVPGAAATAEDPRRLGIALYSLSLYPLPLDFTGVGFLDEPFFVRGFSGAESAWRWTDGRHAAIDYPLGNAADLDTLVLEARALEAQPVEIRLNGAAIGELRFPGGFRPLTRRLAFDPALLRPWRMNRIDLALPRASPTAEDPRLLGLAFVRLELRQAPPVSSGPEVD